MELDVGFDMTCKATIRWAGINAPEISAEAGKVGLRALEERLPEGSRCIVKTDKLKKEKYGRYLGTFYLEDGTNLNAWLVEKGHAAPYPNS